MLLYLEKQKSSYQWKLPYTTIAMIILLIIIYLHMYYPKDKVLQYWKLHKIKLIAIKLNLGKTIQDKETMW